MIEVSTNLNARLPYATPEEIAYLHEIVGQWSSDDLIVMIGAGPGIMLLAMRERNPFVPICVIDIDTCYYAQRHLEMAGLETHNVRFIVADSGVAAKFWSGAKIDFLIVDGEHTYAGVKRDVAAWMPHLSDDATLMFHDYDSNGTCLGSGEHYPGVAEALAELIAADSRFTFVERVGTSAILKYKANG